ncbi:hypothetical protein KUCAC02_006770, partial [Chaenocephalus aceratus]
DSYGSSANNLALLTCHITDNRIKLIAPRSAHHADPGHDSVTWPSNPHVGSD